MENGSYSSSIELEEKSTQPHPPLKQAGGWKAAYYILGCGFLEKLASLWLLVDLKAYLRANYNMDYASSYDAGAKWSYFSAITLFMVAIISDAHLGKFRTLLLGSIASLLGTGIMTLTAIIPQLRPPPCNGISTCPQPQNWQLGILFMGLGLLGIGMGGARPSNIAIGVDQFNSIADNGKKELESFSNWWYFSFNLALLLATTKMMYLRGSPGSVLPIAIKAACLGLSIIILLLGRGTYICLKPQGRSIFVDMAKVITAAYHKRRSSVEPVCEHSLQDPPVHETEHLGSKLARTKRFKYLDKAAVITDPSELSPEGVPRNGWRLCSVQQVEQLKCLLGIVLVWLSTIPCFISKLVLSMSVVTQAMAMDKSIGHFKISPVLVILTPVIIMLIWIIIYQHIYTSGAQKTKKVDARLTMKQKIKVGIVLLVLAMLVAGIVEKERRDWALRHESNISSSPMNVAFLLPQFILIGLSDALVGISIMEFSITQTPEHMRTVVGALIYLGNIIPAGVLIEFIRNAVKITTGEDAHFFWDYFSLGHAIPLEYCFYIIAALGTLSLIYFDFFASRYISSNTESQRWETQLENSTASHSRMLHKCESKDEERGM